MNLDAIQSALRDASLDGWLFYDHHGRDRLSYRILGLPANAHVTRRWWYFVPAQGTPRKLVHRIESGRLDTLPGDKTSYSTWQEMEAGVQAMLQGATRIAMQYSPRNAVMYIGLLDAGTHEMLTSLGKQIVSSADLVSRFEAVLTPQQIASHYRAQQAIDAILEEGWQEIGRRVRAGSPEADEVSMVQFLQARIAEAGLVTEHGPNVSVGPNAADSHYEPTPASSRRIERGSFVLIDIWGKVADDPSAVWYDITWCGVVDREPTPRETEIFEAVRDARDAAIALVQQRFAAGEPIAGWEADRAARAVIQQRGFGEWFTHRTGHNIGTELHGAGAHLDDFESHDERRILPDTCFSVEPGIYLPGEFGVRLEVDMIPSAGEARVTGRVQRELVRI
ncbi:M24 family metallopeptidase [Terriglobus aquaticus]|uniref:M24 family metallopeptidase n=1 Tax=Terriglobus aquaticus TaxID=940139 RepID=A0ABW9KMA6_9BACT|nr:M24 family metallopeptidase [Terriglobus aquaticus]